MEVIKLPLLKPVPGASPGHPGDPVISTAHGPLVSEPPLGFSSDLISLPMLFLQILLGIDLWSTAGSLGLVKCPALVPFVICLSYHCIKSVLYLERRSVDHFRVEDYLACQWRERTRLLELSWRKNISRGETSSGLNGH